MRTLLRKQTGARGFSIMEVLISLVLMGMVTTAVLKTYLTQHEHYLIQDDISQIQQSARASIDELTRQIRMAGYGLPDGLEAIDAYNTNPDTITVNYQTSDCDTYLAAAMPMPSAELKCATDISCLSDNQWVYIFEPDSGGGEWFVITHVQTASRMLQHNTMSLSRSYGKDAVILLMYQVKFYIDNTTDPNKPCMMIKLFGQNPQVYAENISDLQLTYRLEDGTIVDVPTVSEDIREVKISLTGRSANPDPDKTSDPYRLRTYTSSVNVRNIS